MLLAEVREMESNLNREAKHEPDQLAQARPRSSKTLCKRLRNTYDIYVITNDIYTKEDQPYSHARTGASGRTPHGRRNRRLSAYCDSRRRFDEPGGNLLAGGSGIVPLMSMIRSRLAAKSKVPFRLLYSVREPGAVFYRDELQALSDQYDALSITYAYTRTTPKNWPRPAGRIDAALLAEIAWPATLRPICYVCGPTSFVETATDLLIAAGFDREMIKTERFGPTGDRK
jgi:hypothetical protein